MPLLLTGRGFREELEKAGALALYVPLEGGAETRLLRRLRAAGYRALLTSARGLGDPHAERFPGLGLCGGLCPPWPSFPFQPWCLLASSVLGVLVAAERASGLAIAVAAQAQEPAPSAPELEGLSQPLGAAQAGAKKREPGHQTQ